jgi:hypothetical protein
MNTKNILHVLVIVTLLSGAVVALPVSAQTPNLTTSLSFANVAGAPVVNGFFTTDVIASVANYGGSSQVGIIGVDIYISYDPAIVMFGYIEPKTGFFDNPQNHSTTACPANFAPTPPQNTSCLHIAMTQQPGAGPVYNRTGVLATLHWVGVKNGSSQLIFTPESYLIQYPDNGKYSFTTVTPLTVNIGPAGIVQGYVKRYGYIGTAAYSAPVTVTASMGGGPATSVLANPATGYFSFSVQTGGSYSVKALYPGYLAAKRDNVYVSGAFIDIGTTYLKGGDVNLDNCVNIFDLVMMAAWLGKTNALNDINDDNIVDIYDLTLAVGSFNKCGPTAW